MIAKLIDSAQNQPIENENNQIWQWAKERGVNITNSHKEEMKASAIADYVMLANIRSFGDEIYDDFFGNVPRLNAGRVSSSVLRKYAHLEHGGWVAQGFDVITRDRSNFINLKPDKPRSFDVNGKIKTLKYENPPKTPPEPFFANLPFLATLYINLKNGNSKTLEAWITAWRESCHDSNNEEKVFHAEVCDCLKRLMARGLFSGTRNNHDGERDGKRTGVDNQKPASWLPKLKRELSACNLRKVVQHFIERLLLGFRRGQTWFEDPLQIIQDQRQKSDRLDEKDISRRAFNRLATTCDNGFYSPKRRKLSSRRFIPFVLGEGTKKTLSLISHGYLAIGLPGISGGYRNPRDENGVPIGSPYLVPHIDAIAGLGQEFIFCFDNDEKPETRRNVNIAISRTGGLLEEKTKCPVSVVTWDGSEKGIDDFIVSRGAIALDKLFLKRIPLSRYANPYLDFSRYNHKQFDKRWVSDYLNEIGIDAISDLETRAKIIALRSAKGTGKTEAFKILSAIAKELNLPIAVLSHRIQLTRAISNRVGIPYVTAYVYREGQARQFGLCVDSLHPDSQAQFNWELYSGATVFIDEVEQVIWHMLNSSTCQKKRTAIIETFTMLIRYVIDTGGQVVVADADLSTIALDYLAEIAKIDSKEILVLENTHQLDHNRTAVAYNQHTPDELIAVAEAKIAAGEKVLFHTSGQKESSTYGTVVLEKHLKALFPDLKILRIDSETVAEPGHPAMGCIDKLDHVLKKYDVAIASPVIETGVSIDIKDHFGSAFVLGYGSQSVDGLLQTSARLREDVERHVWAVPQCINLGVGDKSLSYKQMLVSANQVETYIEGVIGYENGEYEGSSPSLRAWGKRGSVINQGKANYRDRVYAKLREEGYTIREYNLTTESGKLAKETLKLRKQEAQEKEWQAIVDAGCPDSLELEELQSKKKKTPSQRHREKHGLLAQKYGLEVTYKLVEKDADGLFKQMETHHYLHHPEKLIERDSKLLARLGEAKFAPDVGVALAHVIDALKVLGVPDVLSDYNKVYTKDSLQDWYEWCCSMNVNIKSILGISAKSKNGSAIAFMKKVLGKVGRTLVEVSRKGGRKYKLCCLDDLQEKVLNQFLATEESGLVTPGSITN